MIEPLYMSGCVEGFTLGNVTIGNQTVQVGMEIARTCGSMVSGGTALWLVGIIMAGLCVFAIFRKGDENDD